MKQEIKKAIKEYGFITDPGTEAKKNIEQLVVQLNKLMEFLPKKSFNTKGENAATISELNKLFLSTKDADGKEYEAPINKLLNKMIGLVGDLPDKQSVDPQDVMKPRAIYEGHPMSAREIKRQEISFSDREIKVVFKRIHKLYPNLMHDLTNLEHEWTWILDEMRKIGYNDDEGDYLIACYEASIEHNMVSSDDADFKWDELEIKRPQLKRYDIVNYIDFCGWGRESGFEYGYSYRHAHSLVYDGEANLDEWDIDEYSSWDSTDLEIEESPIDDINKKNK